MLKSDCLRSRETVEWTAGGCYTLRERSTYASCSVPTARGGFPSSAANILRIRSLGQSVQGLRPFLRNKWYLEFFWLLRFYSQALLGSF